MAATPAQCGTQGEKKVSAVIVFGDSIMDPGNNNGLHTVVKANHAPYGKDFAGHVATGRFSNGLIPTDFIAQGLNVKQLLPPYLGVQHTPEELLTGVSFADIPSYVDLLLVGVESFLRNVSARGAKRIGFVGLPPIGCVPSQRTLGGGPHRSCVPERNAAAQLYNTKVQELIRELGKDMAAFPTLVYIDIYTVIQDLVDHGEWYGFTETTRGCCSTGTVEVAVLCDARFAPVCDDVSQHVFFDSYHPTQRAYKVIVDYIFDHYIQFLHL
ncbi:hypothetical protein ACQ4PT_059529 [Festuca glaucescens]